MESLQNADHRTKDSHQALATPPRKSSTCSSVIHPIIHTKNTIESPDSMIRQNVS
ncbi:hypothetical protein I2492_01595 [Budviciaceae bacterium CWB-B4]|uniref:Uncharacterized protein n=2 Tax=Limnobaculum xujianqingii TaxID=2738837 RepID=A0A9D7AFD1_9GAMM|nr:hypothetical protein [Limnobaculum xujianqingii]MBK5071709.1 hypothetical protein [Limnobaculum xujianqingii]MBK5175018.1 hypothetical protein [Limnobaculum xujianqingii]